MPSRDVTIPVGNVPTVTAVPVDGARRQPFGSITGATEASPEVATVTARIAPPKNRFFIRRVTGERAPAPAKFEVRLPAAALFRDSLRRSAAPLLRALLFKRVAYVGRHRLYVRASADGVDYLARASMSNVLGPIPWIWNATPRPARLPYRRILAFATYLFYLPNALSGSRSLRCGRVWSDIFLHRTSTWLKKRRQYLNRDAVRTRRRRHTPQPGDGFLPTAERLYFLPCISYDIAPKWSRGALEDKARLSARITCEGAF